MKRKPLSRSQQKRPLRPVVLVVTEGQTEVNYLDWLQGVLAPEVNLVLIPEGAVAKTVVERAIDRRQQNVREAKRGDAPRYDAVWCLFDRERAGELPNFNNTCASARAHGLIVAASVPCFELWLLLHFHYHDAACGCCSEVHSKLKKAWPTFTKTTRCLDLLEDKVLDAVRHARRLREHHGHPQFPQDPMTDVDLLIEWMSKPTEGQDPEVAAPPSAG